MKLKSKFHFFTSIGSGSFQLIFFCLLGICQVGIAQVLPQARSTDWTIAGLRNATTNGFKQYDMKAFGVVGDSLTANDSILSAVLDSVKDSGAVLLFPSGKFLFKKSIRLNNNTILRGNGSDKTILISDIDGLEAHSFIIIGQSVYSDTSSITQSSNKGQTTIGVSNVTNFSAGDWIQIIQIDSDLVTSSWSKNTVGQIVSIASITSNQLKLNSPLRMEYNTARSPYILKIKPVQNVGLECLKILRNDNDAPNQSSNIYYKNAVNCWVKGVESENCTFSHVEATASSNLHIQSSYFHHAFGYGTGGQAYGVLLDSTTNECRIENNIFNHLRHSMIVQAGANGNVFSYNYSHDAFWASAPNNSAGDMVLHGNYPYSNLFEQNICQNIIIDNSHGPNGPHNTFFRNRAESYGIFFSSNNSPNQNLIGNEIPNNNFPFNIVNYTILGTGHFIHGNNDKGSITPSATSALPDSTYAYKKRPSFVSGSQWHGIGTPNTMGSNSIPAKDRYDAGKPITISCDEPDIGKSVEAFVLQENVLIYPNPTMDILNLESETTIHSVSVYNTTGKEIYYQEQNSYSVSIDTDTWTAGMYFISIQFSKGNRVSKRVLKHE